MAGHQGTARPTPSAVPLPLDTTWDGGGGPDDGALHGAPRGEAADGGRAPIVRTRQLTSPAVIGGSMSQHVPSRPRRVRRILSGGALAVGTAVSAVALAAPAAAADHDWSGVARCESGGNWSINTGNGYDGGPAVSPAAGGCSSARRRGGPTAARPTRRRPTRRHRRSRSPSPRRSSPVRASAPGRTA